MTDEERKYFDDLRDSLGGGSAFQSGVSFVKGQDVSDPLNPPSELRQYLDLIEPYRGTPYYNEFLTLYRNLYNSYTGAGASFILPNKRAAARNDAISLFYDGFSALEQSIRERDQGSISTQVQEQIAAGLNPLLNGVDAASAASAGSGIDSLSPSSHLSSSDSPLDIVGFASQILSIFISSGVSLANVAIKAGESAARSLLMEHQADMLKTSQSAYAQNIAERYVLDNAPQYDEGIGAFPAWTPGSIPGLPDHLQEQGISFARSYYGSDRHRAGQIFTTSDVESGRAELANLYGSAFYSNSLGIMSDTVSKYARLKLSVEESYYNLNLRYNELYDKYYQSLSPDAMADAQNAVLRFKAGYYNTLDPHQIAASENVAAESSETFYNSYDSSQAAAFFNAQNKYGSALYNSLDASSKASYENYFNELMVLSGEIENIELQSQKVMYDTLANDLNSSDPSVRISAAKAVQRMNAKIAARSSRTGWQRFSAGAKSVIGAGVAVAGVGASIAGAAPAAVGVGAAVGGSALMSSDPYGNDLSNYSGLSGF